MTRKKRQARERTLMEKVDSGLKLIQYQTVSRRNSFELHKKKKRKENITALKPIPKLYIIYFLMFYSLFIATKYFLVGIFIRKEKFLSIS